MKESVQVKKFLINALLITSVVLLTMMLPVPGFSDSKSTTSMKPTLSNEDIAAAIKYGTEKKDSQCATVSEFMGIGFRAVLCTPISNIQMSAADATKKFMPFSVNDVTEDMKKPVLHVTVFPFIPDKTTDMKYAANVKHVVLRDDKKQIAIQPEKITPFDETVKNAMGAQFTYQGMAAEFALDKVQELRKSSPEFYVTVIGDNKPREQQDLKVKKKHLEDLP